MSRRAKREEGMLQNKIMISLAILAVLVIAIAGAIIALRGRNKNVSKINEQVEIGKTQSESTENAESASSAIGNKLAENQKDNGENSNSSNSANAATNENASNSSKTSANENTSDLKNTTNSGDTSNSTEETGNSSSTSSKKSTANSGTQNSSNSSNPSATSNSENTKKETQENASNKDKQNSKQQEKSEESKKDEKTPSFIKPIEGEVIKDFSKDNLVFSNTLQEWVTHLAVDIKADARDVVKCTADGTVASIKNDPRYGLTVIVEHQAGFKTVYSNLLTAEFVVEGESVKQGQTLGTVGTSATFEIADESHLHFEMLKDSEYVNPGLYINF